MSKKKTWADVDKGDELDFGGRPWRVAKINVKGKKTRVTLSDGRNTFTDDVATSDRVTFAKKAEPSYSQRIAEIERQANKKGQSLYGPGGEQTRWATEKEAEKAGVGLEPSAPPAPATGDVWDRPSDRVEKMLDKLLGAHLVAETKDEAAGYSVPLVGVDTVASHLLFFHGGIPTDCANETEMLAAHDAQHAAALKGDGILTTNHWHSEVRP